MVGGVEFDHSLTMIAQAKMRLRHQQTVVSKLGFDRASQHADLVRDICAAMQAKVDVLELRHAEMVRASTAFRQPSALPIPL